MIWLKTIALTLVTSIAIIMLLIIGPAIGIIFIVIIALFVIGSACYTLITKPSMSNEKNKAETQDRLNSYKD